MFRIYTEDVNREAIEKIVTQNFDSFTVLKGKGYWKGQAEYSLIVEIETDNKARVITTSQKIKELNKQETVMIVELQTVTEFI